MAVRLFDLVLRLTYESGSRETSPARCGNILTLLIDDSGLGVLVSLDR